MGLDHSPNIVTDGLMAYLDAANTRSYPGSGSIWYDLKGNINFTLQNNPVFISNSAGGSIGFTAANSHYATASSLPTLTSWTIEAWFYETGVSTGTYPAIISEAFNGSSVNFALFNPNYAVSSYKLQTGYFTSSNWYWTTSYAILQNNWHHAVGTYDGVNIKLYINSNLQLSSASSTVPTRSNSGIYLMRRWDSADHYGGQLSTIKIYNRALSAQEIVQNYNATKRRYGL
jgi:hypothetical protein